MQALESGTGETSGLGDWFDEKVSSISDEDAAFFRHWDRLITLEESESFQSEIWTMTGQEREALGR